MDIFEFRGRAASGVDPETEDLAERVIGAAIEVHRHLGPGLSESLYRKALSHELDLRSIRHACEFPVALVYKGKHIGDGRVDILVERRVILELKSTEGISLGHKTQALGYLGATELQLALIINFNVTILKDGIRRVVRTRT